MATSLIDYLWQCFDDLFAATSLRLLDPPPAKQGARAVAFVATSALLIALIDTPDIPTKDIWEYVFSHPRSYILTTVLFVGLQSAIIAVACRGAKLHAATAQIFSAYAYLYGTLMLLTTAVHRTAAGAPKMLAPLLPLDVSILSIVPVVVNYAWSLSADVIALAILTAGGFLVLRAARRANPPPSICRQLLVVSTAIAAATTATVVVASFAVELHPERHNVSHLVWPINTVAQVAGVAMGTQSELPISFGATESERLALGDAIAGGKYRDLWTVESEDSSRTVTINLTSRDFDAYLEVFGANRLWPVSVNDDGGPGLNSRLTYDVAANTTNTIGVTSYGFAALGEYELAVMPHIRVGDAVAGHVEDERAGYATDHWVLDAAPGTAIVAEVSSAGNGANFVPRIRLDGPGIADVDIIESSSGYELKARRPSIDGLYRLEVYSEDGTGGTYRLAVRSAGSSEDGEE